jgi:hypothetical protein
MLTMYNFNLSIPIPTYINSLNPKLAQAAMQQIASATKAYRIGMWASGLLSIGAAAAGTYCYSTSPEERLTRERKEFLMYAAIALSVASFSFCLHGRFYLQHKGFQNLHFPQLEQIASGLNPTLDTIDKLKVLPVAAGVDIKIKA